MIGKQRTTAPILVLALLTLALFGRQAWVQVREHDLWAEQAARLSTSRPRNIYLHCLYYL